MRSVPGPLLVFRIAAWLTCLAAAGPAWSFGPFPSILNPKTYRSPSGQFELYVNPTHRYGAGPGWYRLRKNGREVWAGKRAFTLYDAAVADDGTTGGYAYLGGDLGRKPFVVAVLAPTGKVRTENRTSRTESNYLHTAPNPRAGGVLINAARRELIVRVGDENVNEPGEWWWVFSLDTNGTRTGPVRKLHIRAGEAGRQVLAARHVPGTPLILTHWWRARLNFIDRGIGAIFALFDREGNIVWRRELPHDYRAPDVESLDQALREEIQSQGAILETSAPGRFTVRYVADKQRVEFAIRAAGEGWEVTERRRIPYLSKQPTVASLDQLPLRVLGALPPITLRPRKNPKQPAVHSVVSLAPAAEDGVVCLRAPLGADAAPPALILVTADGKIREVSLARLPMPAQSSWGECAWLGGQRFLVTRSDEFRHGTGAAWWVEFATGTITPIPTFRSGTTERIAACADGGFIVLGKAYRGSISEGTLIRYSPTGAVVWSLSDNPVEGERKLGGAPDDLATTSDGKIHLLRGDRTLEILDPDGRSTGKLALTNGDRAVTCFDEIVRTGDGQFVVRGSSGNAEVIQTFDERGQPLRRLVPRLPQQPALNVRGMAGTSSGVIWLTDYHALYRLHPDGRLTHAAGDPLDPALLRSGERWQRGRSGWFYVLEDRTLAVHVFDAGGTELQVLTPPAKSTTTFGSSFTVKPDGSVCLYLPERAFGPQNLVESSPSGRVHRVAKRSSSDGPGALYLPAGAKRWELKMDQVKLVRNGGRVLAEHHRRPDGGWLTNVHVATVAADGTLAVLEGIPGMGDLAVHTYSSEGKPLTSWPVPRGMDGRTGWAVACDRDRIYLMESESLFAFDRDGKALWRASIPPAVFRSGNILPPMLDPRKGELLLYNGKNTVHRFAL